MNYFAHKVESLSLLSHLSAMKAIIYEHDEGIWLYSMITGVCGHTCILIEIIRQYQDCTCRLIVDTVY